MIASGMGSTAAETNPTPSPAPASDVRAGSSRIHHPPGPPLPLRARYLARGSVWRVQAKSHPRSLPSCLPARENHSISLRLSASLSPAISVPHVVT